MTSRETIELLASRSRGQVNLSYSDLLEVMKALDIKFRTREYRGDVLCCYLDKDAVWRIADRLGVPLYSFDAAGRAILLRPDREEFVTLVK